MPQASCFFSFIKFFVLFFQLGFYLPFFSPPPKVKQNMFIHWICHGTMPVAWMVKTGCAVPASSVLGAGWEVGSLFGGYYMTLVRACICGVNSQGPLPGSVKLASASFNLIILPALQSQGLFLISAVITAQEMPFPPSSSLAVSVETLCFWVESDKCTHAALAFVPFLSASLAALFH